MGIVLWNGYVYVSTENVVKQFNAITGTLVSATFIQFASGSFTEAMVFDENYVYVANTGTNTVSQITRSTVTSATPTVFTNASDSLSGAPTISQIVL